jgi:hypothetical protein
MLSLLLGDNPFFSAAEHIYVGLGAGYYLVLGFQNIKNMAWGPLVRGEGIIYVVPLILGLLVYTRYFKSVSYLSRISASIVVCMGAAIGLRGSIVSDFAKQIESTISLPLNSFDNLVVVVGTAATLGYFYFTKLKSPGLAKVQKAVSVTGQSVMMVALGALFANSMFTFAARLIGRLQFLFGEWIHFVKLPS